MELTLSASEIAGLQATLRTLLSPLDYPTAESWGLEVSRACSSLLRMDKSGTLLPLNGRTSVHSAEFPADMMTRYVDQYHHSNEADRRRKRLRLRVWNRKSVWAMEDLRRTVYYADMVLPMKHFDSAGMSTALDVAGEEAVVYLSREVPDSIHTGARELTLLELLQPAFAAGVRALRAAEQSAAALRGLVEGLEAPIAIFDRAGLLQHAGAAFIDAIERDPQGHEVWESARGLAMEVAGICHPVRTGELKVCRGLGQRTVNTGSGHYRLRGTTAEAGDARHVLVALELARRRTPSSGELQERFKLTAREADVALLLGAGRNNREIAEQLGCSGHTARRHTEQVLAKLEVSCRAKVAAALARL
jgi:DNA-binding CsgD family transcriptional regulator